MEELNIPENLKPLYEEVDGNRATYPTAVHYLIERIARCESALVELAKQHARSGERIAELQEALRCQVKYCSNGQIHTTAKAVLGEKN